MPAPMHKHVLFLSTRLYSGNLQESVGSVTFSSGLEGADYRCEQLAAAANLSSYNGWTAILSTSTINARDRIDLTEAVYNTKGGVIFSDPSKFWIADNTPKVELGPSIKYNELGLSQPFFAWTGTSWNGATTYSNCNNWSSESFQSVATKGNPNSGFFDQWIRLIDDACNTSNSLYCISQ